MIVGGVDYRILGTQGTSYAQATIIKASNRDKDKNKKSVSMIVQYQKLLKSEIESLKKKLS